MTKLSILVPYRPDGGWRDRAWAWNRERIEKTLPDAELVVEGLDFEGSTPEDFSHTRAINRAASRATGDVFLIQDADTAFDPEWVKTASSLVASGSVSWMLPASYRQLTRPSTETVLELDPRERIPGLDYVWIGSYVSWAGLVVVPRRGFERVRGYDERFTRWGADDIAFGMSLTTLWGPLHRLVGEATHLWHPREGLDAQPREQHDLMQRYLDAAGRENVMVALRDEAA